MNNSVTFEDVKNRLEETKLKYAVLDMGDGFRIIVLERGGRIIGPFQGSGESILWINKAFKNRHEFTKFIKMKDWNIGAERLWIAPEFAFFTKERLRFDETYTVQAEVDPCSYSLSEQQNEAELSADIDSPVFEMTFDRKELSVIRRIRKAENPLGFLKNLKEAKVKYCGLEQEVEVKDTSPDKKMMLEPWILTQVNPGGRMLIPYMGEFEFVDYYDPIDDTLQIVNENFVELKATGYRKYKVGYKSANTFGRAAYVNKLCDDNYYLIVKSYYNNPSNPYCCEPWHSPGNRGCSLFVYNDSGENGGFVEFENCGQTTSAATGFQSRNLFTEWFFVGSRDDLEKIIESLLGIRYRICF